MLDKYLQFANAFAEPVLLVNADGVIVAANSAFMHACGLDQSSLVFHKLSELATEGGEEVDSTVRTCVEATQPVEGVLCVPDDTGDVFTFQYSAAPLPSQSREHPELIMFRARSRSAASDGGGKETNPESGKRQQITQADTTKSVFLANLSHEIRTPMTAILGFSDVLLDNVERPENIEAVNIIVRNAEHLLALINDVIDLSEIEKGTFKTECVSCSPLKIATEVVSLMQLRAQAKGLTLEVESEEGISERLQSDPIRLRQIFINLLDNAIKFTKSGTVRFVMSSFHDEHERSWLRFEIIDTGPGMSSGQISKLFEPFSQTSQSTTNGLKGTGLGLVICQRLAELLGGTLTVSSETGVGTTVSVSLPSWPGGTAVSHDNADDFEVASKTDHTLNAHRPAERIKARVLVAEDCPDNRRLMALLLRKEGADVTFAENGQIAFDLATEACVDGNPYDLVLMDMQMPVLDGYTATRKLRQHGYNGAIVALTAHAMSGDRAQCLEAGCDDYLTKPIERSQLADLLGKYCCHIS